MSAIALRGGGAALNVGYVLLISAYAPIEVASTVLSGISLATLVSAATRFGTEVLVSRKLAVAADAEGGQPYSALAFFFLSFPAFSTLLCVPLVLWAVHVGLIDGAIAYYSMSAAFFINAFVISGEAIKSSGKPLTGIVVSSSLHGGLALAGAVLLTYLGRFDAGEFLFWYLVACFLAAAAGLSIWHREMRWKLEKPIELRAFANMAELAPVGLYSVNSAIIMNVGVLILDSLEAHEGVVVLSIASKVSLVFGLCLASVNSVYVPVIARAHSSGIHERLSREVQRVATYAFAASLGVAVLLAGVLPFMRDSALIQQAQIERVLVILVVGNLIGVGAGPVVFLASMLGLRRDLVLVSISCSLLYSLGVTFSAAHYGVLGVAVTTSLAIVYVNVLLALAIHRKAGLRSWTRLRRLR